MFKKKKIIFSLSHFNKLTFIFKIFFSSTFLFIFMKILQFFSTKTFKLLKYKKKICLVRYLLLQLVCQIFTDLCQIFNDLKFPKVKSIF